MRISYYENGKIKIIGKSAEDIKDYFGISKKAFKRAIGSLLKNGLIEKSGDYFILKK